MKIRLSNNDEKGDKKLAFFICTYIIASSLNISVKTIFSIPTSMWSMVSLFFEAIIVLSLVFAIPTLLFRRKEQLIIVEIVFLLVFLFSFLLGEADLSMLVSTGFWTFAVCIPLGIAGISIVNSNILFSMMKKTAYIEYPILCIALLSMQNSGSYSMSVSYVLILPVLFFLYDYFEDNKIYGLVLSILGMLLILIYGARGPLLCITFYIFVKLFIRQKRDKSIRKLVIRLAVIAIIILVIANWDIILRYVEVFLSRNGISSYSLRRLLSGQFSETAGRDDLWNYYIGLIKKKPFVGYGVLGGWISSGEGPHNMLLEFILAFGYLGGGIVGLISIFLLLRAIKTDNSFLSELILILAAYNFTMYLVSGDWLEKPMFFLFVMLTLLKIRLSRKEGHMRDITIESRGLG